MTVMIKPLAYRLELSFWATAITLMSDSKIIRKTIIKSYQTIQLARTVVSKKITIFLSLTGLVLGLILGIVTTLMLAY